MKERLQKVLAAAGVASRRQSEVLIDAGKVSVNGKTASLGESADPDVDTILVEGIPLQPRPPVYIALNKPAGVVSSTRSTHGEQSVVDLVDLPDRPNPVGRLDKDTTGLLFLSSDGDWANLVTHPRHEIEKEYIALVRGRPSREALDRLRNGVRLPDGDLTVPARVEVVGFEGDDARLRVIVIEGKKRQIRLMGRAVGHPVTRLRRVRIGPVTLGTLPEGQWRRLEPHEVEAIREAATGGKSVG